MAGLDWMIHGSRIPDLTDGAKFGRLSLPGYTHSYICISIINMYVYIYMCKAEISESFSPYRIPSKTPSAEKVADVLTKKGRGCECHVRMGVTLFSPKKKRAKTPFEGLVHTKMLRELVNAQMH